MLKMSKLILWLVVIINSIGLGYLFYFNQAGSGQLQSDQHGNVSEIPDLVGTWSGENVTVSDLKGYKIWGNKVIHITEQKDRRFRGTFTYPDGTKNFFGVIYPDNISFTWVASNSRGYNHGRILDQNKIAACYVEAWEEATTGCATLEREKVTEQ